MVISMKKSDKQKVPDKNIPEIIQDLQKNQTIMTYLVSLGRIKKTKGTKKFIDAEFEKTIKKRKKLVKDLQFWLLK